MSPLMQELSSQPPCGLQSASHLDPYSFHNSFCRPHLMAVKTENPLGGRGGWITRSRDRDHPGQHGETPSLLKIQKISWAWWRMPVVPATQEAEAGELPEPGRRRLQWADVVPLHSSLSDTVRLCLKKKKGRKKRKRNISCSMHGSESAKWSFFKLTRQVWVMSNLTP